MSRNDPPERSAEEREQARREREERRGARARREAETRGEPPPPVEPLPYEVPPPEPAAPAPHRQQAPQRQAAAPPAPATTDDDARFFTDEALPPAEPTTREPPAKPSPLPAEPTPNEPVARAVDTPRNPSTPAAPIPPPPTEPAETDAAMDGDAPLPAVRRRRSLGLRPGAQAPRGGGGDGVSTAGRRLPRWVIVALAVLLIALVWFLVSLFQPFQGDGGSPVRVSVPKGASVGQIADILEKRGVVSSSFFFQARATVEGARGDLKPGAYTLKKDMSYSAAINALSKGPARNVVEITIPEGRSRAEVARQLSGTGLRGSYRAATKRSKLLNPAGYGGKKATSLEGFLFPSTYEMKRHAKVTALVKRQLTEFKREFRRVNLGAAKKKNLTAYDVITIASMVERESAIDKDRPLVASVIYNRLKRNEKLDIDATVRFAVGNWSRPLTRSQLATNSPYNTRLFPGLPPGPIGSPGLKSIQAAAHPAKTNFIFYVVKPCGNGQHAFSTNLAQFNKDVARYEAQRRRRRGSPENC